MLLIHFEELRLLYPSETETRSVHSLDGIWQFAFDPGRGRSPVGFDREFYAAPLADAVDDTVAMPVPSAWNDLFEDQAHRDFVGWVWYEREFIRPRLRDDEDLVLRFGSATHHARVYLNGELVVEHVGGFTPFEAVVTGAIRPGANRLTVAVCTILDRTTVPIGNYKEEEVPGLGVVASNTPNFDFYNYTGLQRHVVLYQVPRARITDLTIVSDYDGGEGVVRYDVENTTPAGAGGTDVEVAVLDARGDIVAQGSGASGELRVPDVKIWNPGEGYLYRLQVTLSEGGQTHDSYTEPFGIRRVEVRDGRFLINEKPFYFKGFGKHEDTAVRGRGVDEVMNAKDLRLLRWMGGNSFRTSHYCYSEEFMRLCDAEGVVIIDEVPAVGLMVGFDFDMSSMFSGAERPKTWDVMDCAENHRNVIREMIARDKNHPCVVMWSVGNEPDSWSEGAGEYFAPMFDLARSLDPAARPVTCVLMQSRDITADKVAPLCDVLCLNRYYGWYFAGGDDLQKAKAFLAKELEGWARIQPGKPVLFTEYGADTVAGLHDTGSVMFTEEYQVQYYRANHEIFDRFPHVIGEQAWNFSDFATSQSVLRVQGNKKGLFTRERQPKQAVFALKQRWESIPDFGYEK